MKGYFTAMVLFFALKIDFVIAQAYYFDVDKHNMYERVCAIIWCRLFKGYFGR